MIQDISHIIKVYAAQTEHGVDCQPGHIFQDLQNRAEKFESDVFPGHFETDVLAFADPRTNFNGVRIMCADGSFEMEDDILKKDSTEYDMFRHINGMVEGSFECGGQFPLHLNFQQLNGVSTTKGCYIGQELIQRTTHVGTLRKQTLPFLIKSEKFPLCVHNDGFSAMRSVDRTFSQSFKGLEILDKKKRKIGTVLGSQFNVGTALIDIQKLYKAGEE